MKIIKSSSTNQPSLIKLAVQTLKNGGLLIYPTETCYGIGADATSKIAIDKLIKFKGQRGNKPISIAVSNQKMAEQHVVLNDSAKNIYNNFLPGPVTVISKSRGNTVKSLESANHTLGIRIPDHPLAIKIINQFKKPITATSANPSGKKTPYSIKDILKYTSKQRLKLVSLIIDAGKLDKHPPSTVVDTTLLEPEIIRQGSISIPEQFGQTYFSNSEEKTQQIAQSLLEKFKHYLEKNALLFALQGELGSGKTQFVKGIAKELKITKNVPSPTYVLIREYPYSLKELNGILYHIDTWRMADANELLGLGLNKILQPGNVIAIEWLQKVKPLLEKLKAKIIWVDIKSPSTDNRQITIFS